jgi:hypothetical protein
MKNMIIAENLYNDIDSLTDISTKLEFEDNVYGKTIKDFSYIPEGITNYFSAICGDDIDIQPNTGVFHKPNSMIHFAPFYQHSLWQVVVGLKETTLYTHRHLDTKATSFFDIENGEQICLTDGSNRDKWETLHTISIQKNTVVFLRPWLWHSFEADKLVQLFMLNAKLQSNQEEA